MPYLTGFVTPQDYGAAGNGTADDTAAIQSALSAVGATPGGMVFLPWATAYLISAPLRIPPYTTLAGPPVAMTLNLWTTPPPGLSRLIMASGFAADSHGSGAVGFYSQTPGGWSLPAASQGLRNVIIDGSQATGTLQGIDCVGPVYDTHVEDVFVWKAPHDGLTASGVTESGIAATYAYHQRWRRVSLVSSGLTGFGLTNFTDSDFEQCLAFGNSGDGFAMQNNSNTRLTACRSEWNTGRGYDVTGSGGSVCLTGCTTDQNADEGLRVTAATGQAAQGGGVIVTGGKLHADGNGGTNNRGIYVTGSTVPVVLSGLNVESGQNPNNSSWYPGTALQIGTSANVMAAGCVLQGISSAWTWDSSGVVGRSGCIGATGDPGSQTFTRLSDI